MKKVILFSVLLCMALCGCTKKETEQEGVADGTLISAVPVTSGEDEYVLNDTVEEGQPENSCKELGNCSLTDKIIVLDPGHGTGGTNEKEPLAPGSSEKKAAFVSGTAGKNQTEEELNLKVALMLKEALEEHGAEVHLTRTTHEATLSNVGRAEFANELNADICVRIHADGNDDSSVSGTSVLIPSSEHISDNNLINESKKAGQCVLEEYINATGAKNRGLVKRGDMTGFNWSKVPVILVELGFMTNAEDDALMETESYQKKMVSGIEAGLEKYFK